LSSIVYLNGDFLPRAEARLSVDERGFFFGDGVYEVTRAVHGHLFEADRHQRRLERGLRELRIDPRTSIEGLFELQLRLLRENGLEQGEATVYLQITRGAAPRTHHFPPAGTSPTIFMSAKAFTPPHETRARGVAAVTYPDYRWTRCDLKTVNLLPAVLANQHAVEQGALESVFVRNGAITEGSHTNVFGVIGAELRTHPNSNYILPGVTRDLLVEIAHELEIPVVEMPIFVHELPQLEELFLSGTTSDVMPVVSLDGRSVGRGTPGPVTMSLYESLAARLAAVAAAAAAR
jgi:D-alanine transaminase